MPAQEDDDLELTQQAPVYPLFRDFFKIVQRNGLSVTPADTMTALQALEVLGLGQRTQVRAGLSAVLARSPEQVQVLERLFDLFFARSDAVPAFPADKPQTETDIQSEIARNEALFRLVQKNELLRNLLHQDRVALEMQLRNAAEEAGLARLEHFMQSGYFTFQIIDRLGIYKLQTQVRAVGGGGSALDRALDGMRQAVTRFVQDALEQSDVNARARFRRNSLLDQPLLSINAEQRQKLRFELERLVQILKTRVSRRRTAAKRGQLNLHRTLRRNLINDGVPFELVLRNRRVNKPEIVLLLDMSESVRTASAFMLFFVYNLQELFRKVRSFIFSGHLVETTELLRNSTFDEAVETLFSGTLLNIWEPSNFGRSFDNFAVNFSDALTPKTSLLILGDARNNYNPARAELLQRFREQARHTFWLNPEPKGAWGFGDSSMLDYLPFVDEAVEVRTLRQLSTFINRLVLH